MLVRFEVPTMENQQSAQELKKTILTSEPEATVDINLQTKIVTIESKASEETFRQLIVAAGYSITQVGQTQ